MTFLDEAERTGLQLNKRRWIPLPWPMRRKGFPRCTLMISNSLTPFIAIIATHSSLPPVTEQNSILERGE